MPTVATQGLQNAKHYRWEYADAAARTADTGFAAADVGSLARQLDDNSTWMLTDESPITWVAQSTPTAYTPGGTDVAVADGGTGASTAAGARTNLGLVIGTDVQAFDSDLSAFAGKTAPAGAVVGTSDTQTLTAKTLTAPLQSSYEDFAEIAAPGTPAAATVRLYAKADGLLYSKDDAGVETAVTGGGGGGSGDVVGPASAVASELVLFDGATGKLVKAATGTGLVTATSGVYGTTTAPTFSDFTNAQHDHLDADDGGTLSAAAIASGTVATARLGSGTADNTTFLRGDQTWAVPSGGASLSATNVVMQDDFIGGNTTSGAVGALGWVFSGGSALTSTPAEANHPGLLKRRTSTTINTVAYQTLQTALISDTILLSDQNWDMTLIFRLGQNDANTLFRFGLADNPANSAGGNNGMWIEKAAADTNWFTVTRSAGTSTRTDSGVAVGTGWFTFRVRRTGSGAGFTINGGTETFMNTGLPTAAAAVMIQIQNTAAADKSVDLDYFSLTLTPTR